MKRSILFIAVCLMAMTSQPLFAGGLDEAFALYSEGGKLSFDAQRGKDLWMKKHPGEDGKERHCGTCHGPDLTKGGKHVKSGKPIDPMAPSVNKERFTKLKKIKKWFKRNCKWTVGRECTDQEKGDILKYLSQL